MKMITKRFKKQRVDNDLDIEDSINKALKLPFYAKFSLGNIIIKSAATIVHATCEIPLGLRHAMFWFDAITFSVTLPAKYWK